MKRQRIINSIPWMVAGGLLLAAMSSAQPFGRGGQRGQHGPEGMGRPGMESMRLLRELDLTEEQRQQIRSLLEPESNREAMEALHSARQALNEAVEQNAEEFQLRQLADEVGRTEGEMAVIRARQHARIMEVLTDEQRAELAQMKAEMKQKMEERRQRFEERRQQRRGNREPAL